MLISFCTKVFVCWITFPSLSIPYQFSRLGKPIQTTNFFSNFLLTFLVVKVLLTYWF